MRELGKLFVFEGIDGSGKSALAGEFASFLKSRGRPPRTVAFPGQHAGTIGELVYRLHHQPASMGVRSITAASIQALHIAAHLDAIESEILPSLRSGRDVVLDRYWWSTWAYGLATGVDEQVLSALVSAEREAWGGILPSCLFYIERSSGGPYRDHSTTAALRRAYKALQAEASHEVIEIKNESTLESALAQIVNGALIAT